MYEVTSVVNGARVHEFALLFIVLVLVICAILLALGFAVIFRAYARNSATKERASRLGEPAELVLARRYASGVIDKDEYRRCLDALKGRATPPSA
jgi:uncharacterized membrane protein